jgi:hypothetical protein
MHEQSSKGTQIKSREGLRCLVLSIDHESQVRARRFARNKRTKRSPNMDHQALAHQPSPPTGGRVTVTRRTLAHVPAHMAWISADGGPKCHPTRPPTDATASIESRRCGVNRLGQACGRLIPTITPGVLHRDLFQNKKNPGRDGIWCTRSGWCTKRTWDVHYEIKRPGQICMEHLPRSPPFYVEFSRKHSRPLSSSPERTRWKPRLGRRLSPSLPDCARGPPLRPPPTPPR